MIKQRLLYSVLFSICCGGVLASDSVDLLEQDAVVAPLHVDVIQSQIAMCRVLEEECDQVFDPKITRSEKYLIEDQLVIRKLSDLTEERAEAAHNEQRMALSNKMVSISAKTLGEQTGYAVGVKRLKSIVSGLDQYLTSVVDTAFRQLMIMDDAGRLISPPIIEANENNVSLSKSGKVFRAASQSFFINKNARFVLSPPSWKDYLKVSYKKPKLPPAGLMPQNIEQTKIWNKGIREGYRAGLDHANRVFGHQMNAISRDMEGMIRYHVLRAYNMVSEPKIIKTAHAVTGGGSEMFVNDQILSIDVTPQLNSSMVRWRSLPRMPDITHFHIDGSDYQYEGVDRTQETIQ